MEGEICVYSYAYVYAQVHAYVYENARACIDIQAAVCSL